VQDVQELQRQQFIQATNQAVNAGIAEALKEAGLSEKDWNSVYFNNPEATITKQKQQAKRFAEKLIRKNAKPATRDGKGRFVPQQGQQTSRLDLSQVVEDRRQGKVSSDQALGSMVDSTLHDFFLNGLLR
jgi:hypothetical protein